MPTVNQTNLIHILHFGIQKQMKNTQSIYLD